MQRITLTIDDDLMTELDEMIRIRGYQNRSEAMRELARAGLQQASYEEKPESNCVGVLCYTYDHSAPEVPKKLAETHHDHHDMTVASMHVHLDHDRCLEVSILKGQTAEVRHFADHVKSERHVTNGTLVALPVPDTKQSTHTHHHHHH